MSERIRTLTALAQGKKGLFIVPLNGLKKWLTPVEMWQNHQMTLRVGEDIDVDQFLNKLVNMGYKRESVVSHIGEFSLRGGIIDIFPLIGEPIRIELLIPKLILFAILMLKRSVPKIILKKSISQLQVIISLLKK